MEKSRVLVVGGTGYIGRRIVRASLAQGHPTLVLMRPEIGLDIDKLQMQLSFRSVFRVSSPGSEEGVDELPAWSVTVLVQAKPEPA
jgi:nucleoside-diphosphate-sugar epimerase